jgi:3'-5' exoribonuclease
MSQKQYVSGLEEKQNVQSPFLVREKTLQTYLVLSLVDRTGSIDGRIWDNAENWDAEFGVDDFVMVKGNVQVFQGRKQIVITGVQVIDAFSVDLKDFLASSEVNPEVMMKELMGIVQEVKNTFVKQLLLLTLEDPHIRPLFMAAPAAKTIHHAYLGGLLEHVLSICKTMQFLGSHYRELDPDLLIFGAIYHDIGKIWELKYETAIGYTDVGRWVGHIPLGSELVEKKTSEIPHFPYELKNILKHIVLSHHGKMEYGSPKIPMILEAVVVGYIDDLDSKVNSIFGLMKSERNSADNWTRFSQLYERHFFLGGMRNRDGNTSQ